MSGHTPGPWTANVLLVTAGTDRIVHTGGNLPNSRVEEAVANARLIAAAPDLLAACEEIIRMLEGPHGGHAYKAFTLAEAAVARAKGGAS